MIRKVETLQLPLSIAPMPIYVSTIRFKTEHRKIYVIVISLYLALGILIKYGIESKITYREI